MNTWRQLPFAIALVLLASSTTVVSQNVRVEVVYINGIQNTFEDLALSVLRIEDVLRESANHIDNGGDPQKSFRVSAIWNPIGFNGTAIDTLDLEEDALELFLLKTAEEWYREDLQQLMMPFYAPRALTSDELAAAARVSSYVEDMTPGGNSVEGLNSSGQVYVTDADMARTQRAVEQLVTRIKRLGSVVVAAHSEGNLLANLAYARLAVDVGAEVARAIRIVNVANTSEFSVHGLNFTHEADAALFGGVCLWTPSLQYMASTANKIYPGDDHLRRITPSCPDNGLCEFAIADSPFGVPSPTDCPNHNFKDFYLSDDRTVPVVVTQGVSFTPGQDEMRDRFEDMVYAAVESLSLDLVVPITITRISVDSDGNQANDTSGSPSISDDGRYIAFQSNADNLVLGDTNGTCDIFVHDRITGTTELISKSHTGGPADNCSANPVISSTGRYVTFASPAENLVDTADTSGSPDVFLHDRDTGQTVRVSEDAIGVQGNGRSDCPCPVSGDGQVVAFSSKATNFISPYFGSQRYLVYLKDLSTGAIELVSKDSDGTPANREAGASNGGSRGLDMDTAARSITFISYATNLDPRATNGRFHIFLYERDTENTAVIDLNTNGIAGSQDSTRPQLSPDGRFVAFNSQASDLITNDANGFDSDVFLYDRDTDSLELVSKSSSGTQGNERSESPSVSSDGNLVAFNSKASNLVDDDTSTCRFPRDDVFVHNRSTGVTIRVNIAEDGSEAGPCSGSGSASISGDGRIVSFASSASNLVPDDTNGVVDIFITAAQ